MDFKRSRQEKKKKISVALQSRYKSAESCEITYIVFLISVILKKCDDTIVDEEGKCQNPCELREQNSKL